MRRFARQRTALLVGRLGVQLNCASRQPDAETVHDVRVALRRLSRCLRVFAPFYPPGSARKIRRRISRLTAAAGAVRDCDVAIELAGRAGLSPRSAVLATLAAQRRKAGHDFSREIHRWRDRGSLRQWRSRLEL